MDKDRVLTIVVGLALWAGLLYGCVRWDAPYAGGPRSSDPTETGTWRRY